MRNLIFAASVAALCALTSCSQTASTSSAEGSKVGFSLSLFKTINETTSVSENIVVSPYSAGVALSMLSQGAEGQTKVEFENILNGCQFKAESLSVGDTVIVTSANSIWIDDDFTVRNNFVSLLQSDYDALATSLNLSEPSAAQTINSWCSEHTSGKIDEVVKQISPNVVMLLANALYFKAPWEDQFAASATRETVFHGINGDSSVQMMFRKGRYNYAEYQGSQIIELPYQGERYSMYVVLPAEKMSIKSALSYLDESLFNSAMELLAPSEVRFKFPKMKLETSMNLNDVLKKMGVEAAYTANADFKGISAAGSLVLGDVEQKCFIEVSEGGTEAAAVTTATIALTSFRPEINVKEMTVDRPFFFFIADKTASNILFAGKIVKI